MSASASSGCGCSERAQTLERDHTTDDGWALSAGGRKAGDRSEGVAEVHVAHTADAIGHIAAIGHVAASARARAGAPI